MTTWTDDAIDARYRSSFGRLAGYLPESRAAVDVWLSELRQHLEAARARAAAPSVHPSVAALAALLERDAIVRMYVIEMIDQVPPKYKTVQNVEQLLAALNHIVGTAPLYNARPAERNFFPMSSLFTYMMMTPAGEAAFRNTAFNEAIRTILKAWCTFLDGADSQYVLNEGPEGWLSPSAYEYEKLDQFIIPDRSAPHWGWTSFNAYFHRQIKPECRPIADPKDPKVIVSANDGTVYRIARDVQAQARFWIKGQPYSLVDMLNHSEHTPRFVGGDVFQSFLSGADYHRWHSPIEGMVREARVVDGLMFSDAESAGWDPTAGTYSQGYEASVNTRALVFIQSPDPTIGMVCVMPIGITEISSVSLEVRPGDRVRKGDELGFFSYGGSSMCLVFQRGAIDHFTVPPNTSKNPDDGPPIEVNARIAIAR